MLENPERRQTTEKLKMKRRMGRQKKKRLFNDKWRTEGGDWLVYDRGENVMYCTDCRMYGGEKMKGVVVGTNNFKVETIKVCLSEFSELLFSCRCFFSALY